MLEQKFRTGKVWYKNHRNISSSQQRYFSKILQTEWTLYSAVFSAMYCCVEITRK